MPLLVSKPSKLIVTDDPITTVQYLSKKTNYLVIGTSGNINPGITFANKKNNNQWELSRMHDQSVWSIAINTTNNRLISGESGGVAEWDIVKQEPLVKVQTSDQNTSYKNKLVRYSPTNNDLFAAAVDNVIKIYDLRTAQQPIMTLERHKIGEHKADITSFDYGPDGTKLVTGRDIAGNAIKLWELRKPPVCLNTLKNTANITSVCFHPKNKKNIVVGSRTSFFNNGSIKILNLNTGNSEEEFQIHRHTQYGIYKLCCSPCGKFIASQASDCPVTVWHPKTKKNLQLSINQSVNHITSVLFSPTANELIASALDSNKINVIIKWKLTKL